MKKIAVISVFIFLFGLFSGIFFSTGISDENNSYLAGMLISSTSDTSAGFFRILLASFVSNFSIAALMIAAVMTKLICPLPFLLLWYKSFAIGFCSSLVYLSEAENAFLISLVKILPPALFLIPAFIVLAASTFVYSYTEAAKSKRPSHDKKVLQTLVLISLAAILAGCMSESICHMINI